MKVALVIAPSWSVVKPPISLALLAASLRKKGHDVFLLDLNNQIRLRCRDEYKDKWDPENDHYWKDASFVKRFIDEHQQLVDSYIEQIMDSRAGIVGLCVYYPNQLMSLEIARLIK
ncbi:MAG: hypothetical protein WCL25_03395 [bacterium]